MLSIALASLSLHLPAEAQKAQVQRRTALAGAFAAITTLLPPNVVRAVDEGSQLEVGGALGSTCLGFGCNSYGRPDFNGLEEAPPGSLPYPDFLELVRQQKVEGVVFMPPSGNIAYALIDGKRVRIGKGWPIEVSNSWSSPTWVVRILENQGVPYVFDYDLKPSTKKTYPKPGEGKPAAQYKPTSSPASTRPTSDAPPKMYGTGELEENRLKEMLLK